MFGGFSMRTTFLLLQLGAASPSYYNTLPSL